MRNLIIIVLLFSLISFSSCNDKEQTPQEKIIGTWVGVEFPEQDSAIFNSNNTVILTGRAGVGELTYTIDENSIVLISSSQTSHEYEFQNDEMLYIKGLMPFIGNDDGGILFSK